MRRSGIVIAVVILVAVVFVALWFFGLVPLGFFSPSDEPSDGLNGHTVQSGGELVLSLVDMDVGWELSDENDVSLQADGFRDGFFREICRDTLCYEVTALVFGSSAEAETYYGNQTVSIMSQFSTEERQHGDDSIYWEKNGNRMMVRYRNVVWTIRTYCTFICPFGYAGPGITWIARELIDKVNLVA